MRRRFWSVTLFLLTVAVFLTGRESRAFPPQFPEKPTEEEIAGLSRGEILLKEIKKDSVAGFEARFVVNASLSRLKAVLTDYDHFTEIFTRVKSIEILQRSKTGVLARLVVDGGFQEFSYTIDRHHEEKRIWWSRVEGDFEVNDGEWLIEPFSSGRLLVTYHSYLKIGGFIEKMFGSVVKSRSKESVAETANSLRDYLSGSR